ncbi:transposon Ty3-I Gag-Pol polyprotein [Trichonephila clavipes]|uniref:Transposon Ty3-I Gag-Pol polyprotein n=1 Tax=Trichonephila clavipes TaxID=2585209 RepID=A0A8X6S8N9_TRICX|nr:transposon Ty3-I Gag-Pol polyprotein [Trichonephila clavipes]
MAPRTIDAAVVQKDSLEVDELLSKLVTLEDQLDSLKLQRKFPHYHQRSRSSREVATVQENNDLSTVNTAAKYFHLLNSYQDLNKPSFENRVVKHGIKHHILTTAQPVFSKTRQLAPDMLKLEKQELHLINKKDSTLRSCGDYMRLNAQKISDRYPIPRIEDFYYICDKPIRNFITNLLRRLFQGNLTL